jgi:hypothetical protein
VPVAREYSLLALVSVSGATEQIEDGRRATPTTIGTFSNRSTIPETANGFPPIVAVRGSAFDLKYHVTEAHIGTYAY